MSQQDAEEVLEVLLPNEEVALVQARLLDGQGATQTSLGRLNMDNVSRTLEGVATAIHTGLSAVAPSKVTVELGVQLVVKSGQLMALIVDSESTGTLTITLEWEKSA